MPASCGRGPRFYVPCRCPPSASAAKTAARRCPGPRPRRRTARLRRTRRPPPAPASRSGPADPSRAAWGRPRGVRRAEVEGVGRVLAVLLHRGAEFQGIGAEHPRALTGQCHAFPERQQDDQAAEETDEGQRDQVGVLEHEQLDPEEEEHREEFQEALRGGGVVVLQRSPEIRAVGRVRGRHGLPEPGSHALFRGHPKGLLSAASGAADGPEFPFAADSSAGSVKDTVRATPSSTPR